MSDRTRKHGLQAKMMTYFQANADRVVGLDELLREFSDWPRTSVNGSANHLVAKFPNQLRRPTRGVWVWTSRPAPAPAQKTELLLIEVKRKETGELLMKDTETDALYVVKEFDF